MGFQWQWQANPKATWSFLNPEAGVLRMYAQVLAPEAKSLWNVPAVLLQKFPGDAFTATTKIHFTPNEKVVGEKAGLTTMALSYNNIAIKKKRTGYILYMENVRELIKIIPK